MNKQQSLAAQQAAAANAKDQQQEPDKAQAAQQAQDMQQSVKTLKKTLDGFTKDIEELKKNSEEYKKERNSLKTENDALKKEIESLKKEIQSLGKAGSVPPISVSAPVSTYDRLHSTPLPKEAEPRWEVLLPDGSFAVNVVKEEAEMMANNLDPAGAPHTATLFKWWIAENGDPVKRVEPGDVRRI